MSNTLRPIARARLAPRALRPLGAGWEPVGDRGALAHLCALDAAAFRHNGLRCMVISTVEADDAGALCHSPHAVVSAYSARSARRSGWRAHRSTATCPAVALGICGARRRSGCHEREICAISRCFEPSSREQKKTVARIRAMIRMSLVSR